MQEFIEYGKWARANYDRLGYPSQWYELILKHNIPSATSYTITDERAMAIDGVVCALARYSVLQYQIFCLRYLVGLPEYKIAQMTDERILKNHRNRVKQELDKAGGFICGFLENNP